MHIFVKKMYIFEFLEFKSLAAFIYYEHTTSGHFLTTYVLPTVRFKVLSLKCEKRQWRQNKC